MLKYISSAKTDTGFKRSNNEDAYLDKSELGLLVVADGMGGAAAGEIASSVFNETIYEVFSKEGKLSFEKAQSFVFNAFSLANKRILKHVQEEPHHQGMGCTAEVMVFCEDRYILGHVGDSRTYLFREGQLQQLTRDHSLIQEQIDKGLFSSAEARGMPLRNVILRAVGVNKILSVDVINNKVQSGDIFLLCTDGLTDMVNDDVITEVLSAPIELSKKVKGLIELAKLVGGLDNITIILCQAL